MTPITSDGEPTGHKEKEAPEVMNQTAGGDGDNGIHEENGRAKPGKFFLENLRDEAQLSLAELEKSNGSDQLVLQKLNRILYKIGKNLKPLQNMPTRSSFWTDVPKEIVDSVTDDLKQIIQRRNSLTVGAKGSESIDYELFIEGQKTGSFTKIYKPSGQNLSNDELGIICACIPSNFSI